MSAIIAVENIGKKYILRHQKERYYALRDVMTDAAKELGRKIFHPFASRQALGRSKEEFWALRDVSFNINQGDRIGIIGRNGAGKSTLLKILSRITEPTVGRVRLRGRVASLLEVGTGFHPELTGRENIYLNGAILGMTKAEIKKRFDEIVDFAEVEKFLDMPVKRYSSGMYVRLAFAVAAHLEPDILVVDEVLAVGDAQFQKKCIGKMEDVSLKKGRTVLLVSHNLSAVRNFCNKTIMLHQGTITAEGSPDEVINKYTRQEGQDSHSIRKGYFNYRDRKNPCIQGDTIIKCMRLKDKHNNITSDFVMGEPMRIEVDVSGFSSYGGTEISVSFNSHFGQRICTINTGMKSKYVNSIRNVDEVAILDIPRLPFTSGQYQIELIVAQRGCGYLDQIHDAGHFNVIDADIYGSGYEISSYFGYVYIDAFWTVGNR